MGEKTVTRLPAETVKLITSTQIVTSVSTLVKELIENSIDAGAKIIQVRLENYGLDVIEIKDDGTGVSYDNVQRMFLPGYTSKIRQFEDLEELYSYGFRGEALAAICKIAKVSITTKTASDTLAMTYEIDSNGTPLSSKPSHLNKGTVITVTNLFANLPVRRLYISSKKKISEELKKTEQVVQSLSLIHPELGILLTHNKCPIWRKNSVKGIKQSFMQISGLKAVSKMDHINKSIDQVKMDLIIPQKNLGSSDSVFTNSPSSAYVYVNKRPVICKNISKPVQEHIFHHFRNLEITQKYAVSLVSVEISPSQVDVNLEPNKTKVLLKNAKEIIKLIDDTLSNYYDHPDFKCSAVREAVVEENIDDEPKDPKPKKPRLETEPPLESVGEIRTKRFREKNSDWQLEIINEDCDPKSNTDKDNFFQSLEDTNSSLSLCSQINATNCVLTTDEEVSELNTLLNENHLKLVTSTNSKNCETRLIDRNDIQSRPMEKQILPEWPKRPNVVVERISTTEFGTQEFTLPVDPTPADVPVEEDNKSVQKIAEEIEKDAEEWCHEIIKAIKNESHVEESTGISNLKKDSEQFDLSMQSISSQMGKKELKGFTKFAKIMRPKIIQEFPKLIFTQVAGILAERWEALTPDEVKYYENLAEVIDTNRKIHQENKQNSKLPDKPSKPPTNENNQLKTLIQKMKKKTYARPPRKEVTIKASLSDALKPQTILDSNSEEFELIGQLKPSGNWLYKKGNEIGHVRHQGLQELIISQKMLSSHSVPRMVLDKPITVTENSIGSVLWNVLITLESEYDSSSSTHIITSDVIVKNGFRVEMGIDKTNNVILSVSITEIAACIPHYGISDLKDALGMYFKNGECLGLANWRPTSVTNYITNEAIRQTQQYSEPPDSEEMEKLMNTYHLCLRHLSPVCLHSREIFVPFYHIQEEVYLSSQSQTSC